MNITNRRIAHAAGIKVFVTGGIGGVHRFCEETMGASHWVEPIVTCGCNKHVKSE